MKKIKWVGAVLCVAALVTACGGETVTSEDHAEHTTGTATATDSPSPSPATPGAPAAAATITMANMSFGAPVTAAPGATIAIKNDDTAEHSVTSETPGLFDVHVDGGQQGTLTAPTTPGEYPIYCIYHPSMKGTLIVA